MTEEDNDSSEVTLSPRNMDKVDVDVKLDLKEEQKPLNL